MTQIPVQPVLTEYLHSKASRIHLPLSGSFELTPVCNMNCRMCYVRMSHEQQAAKHRLYTAEEWIELGKTAKDRGMLYLLLTGGEPFLRKDIRRIIEGLHALGLIISINSNATLITEENVAWLKECPPTRINVTLYGASDETYARLCGNPQGFTQATHAIELLCEAGISVKINCSLTPYNVCDLAEIVPWVKEHHLILQATSYMFPPLRKDPTKIGINERFTPEEAAYYSVKTEQYVNGDEVFVKHVKENSTQDLLGSGEDDCLTVEEGLPMRCRAGKCSFWVTWDGRLLPCGMMPPNDSTLNVFEAGLDRAWQSAIDFAAAIRLPPECTGCSLKEKCKACAAMVYTESGNFTTVPEYRCRLTHAYEGAYDRVVREITGEGPEKPDGNED